MLKIFVINGAGGSGKDTFLQFVQGATDCLVGNVSTVDPIKDGAKKLGWNPLTKTAKDRKFLSDLKDLCTDYCDLSINYIKSCVKAYSQHVNDSGCDAILFIHCREPREIARLVDRFNATTILVSRPSFDPGDYGNHSDDGVWDYPYDIVVSNSGTLEDLSAIAEKLVEDALEGRWQCLESAMDCLDGTVASNATESTKGV